MLKKIFLICISLICVTLSKEGSAGQIPFEYFCEVGCWKSAYYIGEGCSGFCANHLSLGQEPSYDNLKAAFVDGCLK